MKHAPTVMLLTDRTNRVKQAGDRSGGRRWRVWTNHYTCPVCQATKKGLNNTMSGYDYICDGEAQRKQRES